MADLPLWAQDMRDLFRSGSIAQFILYGNIFDLVPAPPAVVVPQPGASSTGTTPPPLPKPRLLPLKSFLEEVMFCNYDVVLHYDRGKGIRPTKGADDVSQWLESLPESDKPLFTRAREPGPALEIIDRYLLRTLNLRAIAKDAKLGAATGGGAKAPNKIAIILDFAQFIVPAGNPASLGGDFSANIVKALTWANDPAILQSNIITVLLTEQLNDLNDLVINNPHPAKLKIPLPDEKEMLDYLATLQANVFPDLAKRSEVPLDILARRLAGLSRVGARTLIGQALNNDKNITSAWLTRMKKDAIERETNGLLEFVESNWTLDNFSQGESGEAIKQWLRDDAALLKQNNAAALPMGYLISGRIGTGKTFLVNCWAGELGVPCVVFKNFRDKWVGATESNLEKIFSILRALGQVVVFVDEADQMTGKRESNDDSGLSGRVYAMLAKEMSDTRNRGKIIWVFATSRPDLLEVDLKRPGRLDVHIPLFPPQTPDEMKSLFTSIAAKFKFPLPADQIPDMPATLILSGNEVESLLVRVQRQYALAGDPKPNLKDLLTAALNDARPNPNTKKLEYMDLVAVKECTDARFLPPAYKALTIDALDARLAQLKPYV